MEKEVEKKKKNQQQKPCLVFCLYFTQLYNTLFFWFDKQFYNTQMALKHKKVIAQAMKGKDAII